MAYNKYIDDHGRLIEEHTNENNETITDYVGVFVKEFIDKENALCKKYIDKNGIVVITREKPEGYEGLWIGKRKFLGEISADTFMLQQMEPVFTEFKIDKRGLWKEIIKAEEELKKRMEEDVHLYNKLAKKIEDDKNKS